MLTLLLVLTLSHSALTDEQPYCAPRYRRLCQGKGRHVACQYPNLGPGPSCRNYTRIKFTSDLKHFLVHYINKRRQRVAAGGETVRGGAPVPRPQIMMLVSWDRELATLAQRLANQCSFVHDDCRATVRYPYAGQSVGEVRWRGGGGETLGVQRALRRVLDAWWGERRRVSVRQLTEPFRLTSRDMSWGHFSQLAVWRLRAVGCGATRHGDQRQHLLLVCDFSHTNMLGQRTIVPGPLATCPTLTMRRSRSAHPLLCAPVKRPTPKKDYQDNIGYDYDYDVESVEEHEEEDEDRTTELTYRSTEKKKDIKSHLSMVEDEFDMEIDPNIYEGLKQEKYLFWETTRPRVIYEQSRELPEIEDYVHLKAKNKLLVHFEEKMKTDNEERYVTRPRDFNNELRITKGSYSRPKWRPTRFRPQRPGANALLNKPTENLQRPSIVSFVLDEDDLNQLFKDTGFSVNWRQQTQLGRRSVNTPR